VKVQHYVDGQTPVMPQRPVILWRLIYSGLMEGPVLQGRHPEGEWQSVLCVDADGLLDPSYSPDLKGLQVNIDGHIACVPSYGDEDNE